MHRVFAWSELLVATLASAGCGVGCGQTPKIMDISLQHYDRAEEAKYPWGWIRWLMSSKLDSGAAQTFGIVEIRAGQKNSLHMHPVPQGDH